MFARQPVNVAVVTLVAEFFEPSWNIIVGMASAYDLILWNLELVSEVFSDFFASYFGGEESRASGIKGQNS